MQRSNLCTATSSRPSNIERKTVLPASLPEADLAALPRLSSRYRFLRRIGMGGMSQVCAAWDLNQGCPVALKLLHQELAEEPGILRRFLNEAYALHGLQHPGIVSIFDWGRLDDDRVYLAMGLMDESLRELLLRRGGRISESEALAITGQMAETLNYVHAAGLVHRDIKPGNVMFKKASYQQARLLDFGLAKVPDVRQGPGTLVCTDDSMMPGTAEYMAPEQWQQAATVDGRADVYSLGVVLYELLAGQPPFIAADPVDLMAMHLYAPPPLLPEHVPVASSTQELLSQLLAKNAAERPAMTQVAQRLCDFPRNP